ncbi:MAG: 50S ribosomal protein L25/general stress protein Ctc [Sphingomonadales bacterium]
MAEIVNLAVKPRERAGKGAARAARREGLVPGVVYGDKKAPEMINIERPELIRIINRGHFLNSIFEIELGGKKQRVLPRDLQLHPVTDIPLHIDLLRVSKGATVVIEVPVHFTGHGASPGLKRGGVLNVVRHEVEVECPADSIPEQLEIKLDGLDINDSIHISAVTLPPGAKPTITDRDFTIATIAPSSGARSEAAGEGEDEGEAESE